MSFIDKNYDDYVIEKSRTGKTTQDINSLFHYSMIDYNRKNDRKNRLSRPKESYFEVPKYLNPSIVPYNTNGFFSNEMLMRDKQREIEILKTRPMPEAAIRSMHNNVSFSFHNIMRGNHVMNSYNTPYQMNQINFPPPLPGQKYPNNPYSKLKSRRSKIKPKYSESEIRRANELLEQHGFGMNNSINSYELPNVNFNNSYDHSGIFTNKDGKNQIEPLRKRVRKAYTKAHIGSRPKIESFISRQWNPIDSSRFFQRIENYLKKQDKKNKQEKNQRIDESGNKKKDYIDQALFYQDKDVISNLIRSYKSRKIMNHVLMMNLMIHFWYWRWHHSENWTKCHEYLSAINWHRDTKSTKLALFRAQRASFSIKLLKTWSYIEIWWLSCNFEPYSRRSSTIMD